MKAKTSAVIHLLSVYVFILGLTALLSAQYPSQIASFVRFFLPIETDLTSQPFIRYRMALFLTATIVLLILAPIIGYFGIPETNIEKFRRIHWSLFVVAILAIPIGWICFPLLALCTTCWTGNDVFYFALTVGFFIALQIFMQAIVLKLILKIGK